MCNACARAGILCCCEHKMKCCPSSVTASSHLRRNTIPTTEPFLATHKAIELCQEDRKKEKKEKIQLIANHQTNSSASSLSSLVPLPAMNRAQAASKEVVLEDDPQSTTAATTTEGPAEGPAVTKVETTTETTTETPPPAPPLPAASTAAVPKQEEPANAAKQEEQGQDQSARRFAFLVIRELERWFEKRGNSLIEQAQAKTKAQSSAEQNKQEQEKMHDEPKKAEAEAEAGEDKAAAAAASASLRAVDDSLLELGAFPALTEFVSNWTYSEAVATLMLDRADLQRKLLDAMPSLHPLPLLFLGSTGSVNEFQASLVRAGAMDRVKIVLREAAGLADATTQSVSEGSMGTIIHALCTLIYVFGSDHSQNFSNLRPIARDPDSVRCFARIFINTWSKGAGSLSELTMLAAVKLVSCLLDPDEAEFFVSTTQFPLLPASQFDRAPTLRLASHLMQAYGGGAAAGHVLNQFPAIVNTMVDAVQDSKDARASGQAANALFNGTDSEAGSQAVMPFASTLVDVFSRAPKYSNTWNGVYGALGNLTRCCCCVCVCARVRVYECVCVSECVSE